MPHLTNIRIFINHFFFLLAIFSTYYAIAQEVKQGDNLKVEFKKVEKPYYF
jgi:hypothetical protein